MQEKLKLKTPDEVFAEVSADRLTRDQARYYLKGLGVHGHALREAALEYAERERVPFPATFAAWLSH